MIIEGKIKLLPEERVSKKGSSYVVFSVSDRKMNISKLFAFEPLKDRVKKSKLQYNEAIVVDVKPMEGGSKSDDVISYMVNSFTFPDRKEEKEKETKKRIEASKGMKEFLESKKYHEENGFKYVKINDYYAWRPEKNCVLVDGKWHDKLEFCLDCWGGEKVTDLIRSERTFLNPEDLRKLIDSVLALVLYDHKMGKGKTDNRLEENKEGEQVQEQVYSNGRREISLHQGSE